MSWTALSLASLLAAAASLASCESGMEESFIEIELNLPAHFPTPSAPPDNALTAAGIELGRHLFYDPRLSLNESLACADCHKQEFAFADNLAVSKGATGEVGVLNAPGLGNVIYAQPLTWAHGEVTRIEDQLLGPMFGEAPLEMGLSGNEALVTQRLQDESTYARLFESAYPGEEIDLDKARFALASFVRSLLSYRSDFDRFLAGDTAAISGQALRGSELFYSERLGCSHCHVGFAFTTAVRSQESREQQPSPYHNIGLYNIDGNGAYPESAQGLFAETGFERDMGRFRVPSLRNVELSAPYGHDGSVATLEEFIQIYEAGGRHIEEGPSAGDGRTNPWRSGALKSFTLDDEERAELVAFLRSLTDREFVSDPRHADPW